MSERVTMPALGESVTEGTVTRWLKSVGDEVAVDEPLLEVSTDKVDTEIPSPVAGTLQEILAQEDDTVPVGADLAVIGDGAQGQGDGAVGDQAQGQAAEAPAAEPAPPPAAEPAGQGSPAPDAEAAEAAPAEVAPSTEQPVAPQTSEPEAAAAAQQEQPGQPQQGEQPERPEQQGQAPHSSQPTEPVPAADAPTPPTSGGGSAGETVKMPALGESVTEGTVTRWLKAEGDTVEADEPLLEVSTDKVDTEIPSPVAGTLTKILVSEDDTVPVGGDLAVIGGEAGGAAPTSEPASEPTAEPAAQQALQAPQEKESPAPACAPAAETHAPAAGQAPAPAAQAAPAPEATAAAPAPPAPPTPPAPAPAAATPGAAPADPAPTATPAPASTPTSPGSDANGGGDSAAYVTPLVRKLAAQHEVDLASLTGTGIGGRIRKQDVLDAAEAAKKAAEAPARVEEPSAAPAAQQPSAATAPVAAASPKRGTTERMTRLRKIIAQRMVESLQVSAQLTTVVEVDLTKVARLRERAKKEFEAREGTKLSYLPFLALAAVEALKAHPALNSSVTGDEITYHGEENLSIAVDTEKGLIVPVVKHAGDLNIAGLARAIADIADRTRNNKITPDDLAGGTFTITNTGSRGALFDTPIINQPQVGILGTGALVKRPVVVVDADGGETIAVRSMMYLALSYDHRIVDGAEAARFLTTMKTRLEEGRFQASLGL
jgi:2-oxoglutarate dehydrogenase E2 component (dihydrolipoamide succinyltransferase)